jgi:hypothetical protein
MNVPISTESKTVFHQLRTPTTVHLEQDCGQWERCRRGESKEEAQVAFSNWREVQNIINDKEVFSFNNSLVLGPSVVLLALPM